MTLRELNEMARVYGLDPDATLMAQPLLKDKARKITSLSVEKGAVVLRCNAVGGDKRKRTGKQ